MAYEIPAKLFQSFNKAFSSATQFCFSQRQQRSRFHGNRRTSSSSVHRNKKTRYNIVSS